MSKLQFQATVTLAQATTTGESTWDVTVTMSDGEGLSRGRDIQAGDVIVLNTSMLEVGTYTRYDIKEVKSVSRYGDIVMAIEYRTDNDNLTANPPLDYLLGSTGTIARPSTHLGLLPVISPQIQGMPDSFSFYTLNYNLTQVLDQPRDSGGVNAKLITTPWLRVAADGRALLPSVPLGDFVFDMAVVAMMDGSVLELMGVKPQQDPETLAWYAVIPSGDMTQLAGQIGAITVTYLIDSQESTL